MPDADLVTKVGANLHWHRLLKCRHFINHDVIDMLRVGTAFRDREDEIDQELGKLSFKSYITLLSLVLWVSSCYPAMRQLQVVRHGHLLLSPAGSGPRIAQDLGYSMRRTYVQSNG